MKPLDAYQETFREEAGELLAELEAVLLEMEENPGDADLIGRAFRAMHTIKGSGSMFGFDDVASFTHEIESVFTAVRNGRLAVTQDLIGLALAAKDEIRALLDGTSAGETRCDQIVSALRGLSATPAAYASEPVEPGEPSLPVQGDDGVVITLRNPEGFGAEELQDKKLGEILVERGDISPADLQDALGQQKRIGELLVESGKVASAAVEAALVEQRTARSAHGRKEASDAASSIRVGAEKLDSLVDLVGELVIAQARLTQLVGASRRAAREGSRNHGIDGAFVSLAEEIARLTESLRDTTLNIRLLPIGTTFGKLRRLVHDLGRSLDKEVELVTEGADTELDKTVIDRLSDPLVHLLRNSLDHGIEPPDVRSAAGKPRKGTVRLSAYHSGPNVYVEIQDDGAGLDPDALRSKAVDRALLAPDAKISDKDLFGLIFLPGFSTAKAVSSVSGRGVGMDVVKRAIDGLRGAVEVESTKGAGTTFRLKLPLTLAIIDGLLVAVGPESYVLPLSLVEECVELTREAVEHAHGRSLVALRGELVPYLRLRERFEIAGDAPEIEQVAIANVEGFRFGLAVDRVVGQHQTVTKPLGRMYRRVEGLSGATILGDGTVALILDVPVLLRKALEQGDAAQEAA